MPFARVPEGSLKKAYSAINNVVIDEVLPNLHWEHLGRSQYVWILPNSRLIERHFGPTQENDTEDFFALCCRSKGLSMQETGLWLDTRLREGITAIESAGLHMIVEKASLTVFDRRKPIYTYGGYYRALIIL